MLNRGRSFLIRLLSSSSASASEAVVMTSMLRVSNTIRRSRSGSRAVWVYCVTRFFSARALPTYSASPLASSMR